MAAAAAGTAATAVSGGAAAPWSSGEEMLLCAVVHEFGSNWALVADVLAASASMSGVFRPRDACRFRFRTLTVHVEPSFHSWACTSPPARPRLM